MQVKKCFNICQFHGEKDKEDLISMLQSSETKAHNKGNLDYHGDVVII